MKKLLLALLLIPSTAFTQGYEIDNRPIYIPKVPQYNVAPAYPIIPPANQPAVNNALKAQTFNSVADGILKRDAIISQRMYNAGIDPSNTSARTVFGAGVEAEIRARSYEPRY